MNAGPRVLLVTTDYPPARGGIQYLLHGVVRHATRVRFRVVTLGERSREVEDRGVRVRAVSDRGSRTAAVARLNAAAVQVARSWRPDVVLSGHIVLAPAARLSGAPYVQYVYAKEMAHRPRLTAFAVRHADATIVLGEHGGALARAARAPADRVYAIPPGIDVPSLPATTVRERAASIVTVARLEDRYKGFDVLVRALPLIRSRVPEVTMTFVGAGMLRHSLEALARGNGCDDVLRCTGWVDDGERDALLSEAAVFAMPSRLPSSSGGEGFGIVYLEAGAHGVPVVAGDVGGARDAVVDGETGVLVAPEDHIAVAEAISGLLLDRERASSMGADGRRWAECHAWPRIVERVEDVLVRVAEHGR